MSHKAPMGTERSVPFSLQRSSAQWGRRSCRLPYEPRPKGAVIKRGATAWSACFPAPPVRVGLCARPVRRRTRPSSRVEYIQRMTSPPTDKQVRAPGRATSNPVNDGAVVVRSIRRKYGLPELVSQITRKNRHAAVDWGPPRWAKNPNKARRNGALVFQPHP
jgi:hypothetical protein